MTVVKPLANYLLVRKDKAEHFSAGGIFIGEQENHTGEVLAVGPGKWNGNGQRESMWGLKPGDRIVFSPNGNTIVKVDGEELTMIRRDAVIGEPITEEGA